MKDSEKVTESLTRTKNSETPAVSNAKPSTSSARTSLTANPSAKASHFKDAETSALPPTRSSPAAQESTLEGSISETTDAAAALNKFSNDGSFLAMILAQSAACRDISSSSSPSPPPSGTVGASSGNQIENDGENHSTVTSSGTSSHRGKASITLKRPTPGPADIGSTKGSSARGADHSRSGGGASSCSGSFHPEPKKHKSGNKKTEGSQSSGAPSPDRSVRTVEDDEEDEAHRQAKQEFLRAMRIMEEAGLVTEKGIGAGMVK